MLWPPDAKSWLTGKDPEAGKDWEQGEKGTTEVIWFGWHYWLNGHGFEQIPGDSEGQGSLECCSLWGLKESDTTYQQNNRAMIDKTERLITCLDVFKFSLKLSGVTVILLNLLCPRPGMMFTKFLFQDSTMLIFFLSGCSLPNLSPFLLSCKTFSFFFLSERSFLSIVFCLLFILWIMVLAC